ncbi:AMP-binding protein [Streptomyces sp. H23]|uniref:AMP-binding protein n=1 Tax=Streptomyces sp. H23 TaxID=2541723 RepID=UPI00142F54D7|nr:AMP-binding protein [Streptomyces sp. H23]
MNVLILGGSYFLGPRVVAAFQSRGWSVSVLNRGSRVVDGAEQLVADRDSEQQMREALGQRSFDAVVDISCYTGQQAAVAGRVLRGRARSITLVSSAAVYAHDDPAPRGEDAPTGSPNPWGEYGSGKSEAEREYLEQGPAPALTVLRAAYIYGAAAWDGRETRLWQLARGGEDIVLPGDGSTRIQLLHVDDFAAAVLKAVESARPGPARIYNVAGPVRTLRELALLAVDVVRGGAAVTSQAASGRSATPALPYPAVHCNLDARRIEDELGWHAEVALPAGLSEVFSAYARRVLTPDPVAADPGDGARSLYRALAGVPEVADVEVLPAEGRGYDVLLAADAPVDTTALAETLRAAAGVAVEVRRVPAIPLTPSGRTDPEQLRSLPSVTDRRDRAPSRAGSGPRQGHGGRQALIEVPAGPSAARAPQTLGIALERAANAAPEQLVTCWRGDGRRVEISYGQLALAAREIAGRLHAVGMRPGEVALVPVGEVDDFVRIFWGCVVAGVVPVPVGRSTVVRDTDRLAAVLSLLDGCWTLARGEVHELARPALKNHPAALARLVDPFAAVPALPWTPPAAGPDDPALMLLTSGSTGVPKGVPLTHRNVLSRTYAAVDQFELRPDDTLLNWLPMDHVGGIVMMHVGALCLGQPQVQIAPEFVLADPLRWMDLLSEHRAAMTWAPHFAFAEVNRALGEESRRGPWDLSSLRVIINGGEAVDTQTAADFMAALEPHGLRFSAMMPTWGMSETSSGSITTRAFARWTAEGRQTSPVGRPLPGMALRIVDDNDALVSEEQVGHLQVSGPMVIDRYAGPTRITRDAFTADGWFRTGDIGMVVDQELLLTGRSKDVVVINGVNVSCQEIEAQVQRIPGVRHGYTAACPFRPDGAQTDSFIVFFALADETAPAPSVVREVRRRLVAESGLSPVEVVATLSDAVPRTNIGKVRRPELLASFQDRTLPVLASDRMTAIHPVSLAWHPRVSRTGSAADRLGTVLVSGGRLGLGAALTARIRSEGGDALVVAGTGDDQALPAAEDTLIDTTSAREWTALLESLHRQGRAPDVIVLTGPYEGGARAGSDEWRAVLRATAALAESSDTPRTAVVAYVHACPECSGARVPYLPEGFRPAPGAAASLVLLAGRDGADDADDAHAALRDDRLDPVVRYRRGTREVPWAWSAGTPDAAAALPVGGTYATIGGDAPLWSELSELTGVTTEPCPDDPAVQGPYTGILALLPGSGPTYPFGGLVAHEDLHGAVRRAEEAGVPLRVVVGAADATRDGRTAGLLADAFAHGGAASLLPTSEQEMRACAIRGEQPGSAPADGPATVADVMRRIWSGLLRRPVGADENVFGIGADSMMVQRFLRACGEAGWRIDAFDVFSGQTVEQMSALARPVGPDAPVTSRDAPSAVEVGADDDERLLIEARLNSGV